MKYRVLAFLDKITGHHLHGLCGWVWDYELAHSDFLPMDDREYVDYVHP